MHESSLQYCIEYVKANTKLRYFSCLFAENSRRFLSILAFANELTQLETKTSIPHLQRTRLLWWKEALIHKYTHHPVLYELTTYVPCIKTMLRLIHIRWKRLDYTGKKQLIVDTLFEKALLEATVDATSGLSPSLLKTAAVYRLLPHDDKTKAKHCRALINKGIKDYPRFLSLVLDLSLKRYPTWVQNNPFFSLFFLFVHGLLKKI